MRTFILYLFLTSYTFAQSSPGLENGDFEKWREINNFNLPENWSTDEESSFHHSPSSAPHSGKFALILSTWYSYVEGNMFYGDFKNPYYINWTEYNVPFEGKPKMLSGYYKYTETVNLTDRAGGKVIIKDSSNDTLAYGEKLFEPVSEWTYFEITLTYHSQKEANSLGIWFTSRLYGNGMNENNYPNLLHLDDLNFVY